MSASWVEPIIERLEQSRAEAERVVAAMPAEAWSRASAYAGWSCKDQLSHLAESHSGLQSVLQAVIDGRDPDFSRFDNIDEMNEAHRLAHLDTAVAELLAQYSAANKQTQELMAGLSAEHSEVNLGRFTLGQALQGFSYHDSAHLGEIAKAAPA